MPTVESYAQFGGVHPETAAVANTLAALGIRGPRDGAPLSEALVLAVGGGLGAGYILWEFKEHGARVLVLGFRNRWQYPVQYLQNLCDRLGVPAEFFETGGRRAATDRLDAALSAGIPAIAWVDRAHMPYLGMPAALKGHIGHVVTVYGAEGGRALLDDLALQPFSVPLDTLADGRARISSYKNRLLVLGRPPGPIDLAAALLAGLRDCADHLAQPSDSFSLPTFRKWARTLTDAKATKGWPAVFADGSGLLGALGSIYEGVALLGQGGGALRSLYAEALADANVILGRPALSAVAEQYRALASAWDAFAEEALPDTIPACADLRRLLRERHRLLMAGGEGALAETAPLTAANHGLQAGHRRSFPAGPGERGELFAALGARLGTIYRAEVEANAALRAAVAE